MCGYGDIDDVMAALASEAAVMEKVEQERGAKEVDCV